jgi:predicted membrane protein
MANEGTNFHRETTRWIPGAILILIGTLILLDHMNVINGERIWRYWPLILIALGIAKFVNEGKRVGGVLLTLIGTFFLLQNLGYGLFSWANFWPFLIIAAGAAMIWGRFDMPELRPGPAESGENTVHAFALFGGIERRVHTNSFKDGQITAMFGGVEMDFRSADIEGEEATIYMDAIFGGIELLIPDRWVARWEGQNIFGGYSDETRAPLPDVPGAPAKKRLVLRGRAMFGGISIKN